MRHGANLRGLKILLVEDDSDTRDLLAFILEKAGATVDAVGSARAALDHFKRQKPDAILSDIGLPDEDGRWFIRNVREVDANVPAAAVTAYNDEYENLSAGFDLHIRKPVDSTRLLTAVARLATPSPR